MRLIDADALKKNILDLQDCYNGFSDTYDKACIIGVIDEQPSADVRENAKGEWKYFDDGSVSYYCSACGKHQYGNYSEIFCGEFYFCPNCGAEMRGDKNG